MFVAISIVMMASITGCATRSAPDFKGRWTAVNRFSEATEAIPLHQSYVFYPAPMDRTLKTMLARWAQDSGMTLSYQHRADFTLHAPVTQVRTGNLQEAVSLLTRIYAEQQVVVTASENEIIVESREQAEAKARQSEGADVTKPQI